jgi:hypothetical protein
VSCCARRLVSYGIILGFSVATVNNNDQDDCNFESNQSKSGSNGTLSSFLLRYLKTLPLTIETFMIGVVA